MRISIINSNTIKRRLRNFFLICAGAGAVSFGVGVAGLSVKGCMEKSEYNSRKEQVIKYAESENFESAEKLLNEFSSSGTLNKEDISALELKIESIKQENEKKKLEKIELEKATENEQRAFEGLSLEDALYKLERNFLIKRDYEILDKMLLNFDEHLRKQDKESIASTNFSNLERSWRNYLDNEEESLKEILNCNNNAIIEEFMKGKKVQICDKMGEIDENGIRRYYYSDTPLEIPLGKIGTYIRDSRADNYLNLIQINGKEYWFHNKEIIPASKFFDKIFDKMSSIEKFYNSVKKEADKNKLGKLENSASQGMMLEKEEK